jgi:hypothetical protein
MHIHCTFVESKKIPAKECVGDMALYIPKWLHMDFGGRGGIMVGQPPTSVI